MKLLVIDDNSRFTSSLYYLFKNTHTVHIAHQAAAALQKIQQYSYDVILLDLCLPDQPGQQLYTAIRNQTKDTPVIILSAENNPRLKVQLLENGVSDYVTKPVFAEELRARVMMQQSRKKLTRPTGLIRTHDLLVNSIQQSTSRNGRFIFLRPKEFQILACLAQNLGQVVSQECLAQNIWQQPAKLCRNNLQVHLNMLRKKIDSHADVTLIQTIHGVGYRLRNLPPCRDKNGGQL